MTRTFTAMAVGIITASLHAQWLHQSTPGIPRTADGRPNFSAPAPRTADGRPDLSGIWALTTNAGGVRQLKPSEIKPWALKLAKEREETLFRDSPRANCLPSGQIGDEGLAKIVQTPNLILMLGEDLAYRQIFLDGRDLPKDPNPAWMGYSVGRWDGDTLVVESTGYNDRTWLEWGYPHTEGMRITERFRRDDFGHISVDASYSDPGAYTKPWTAKRVFEYRPDTELIEYVCAEDERDHVHLVGKNSDDLKNVVKVAPEILGKYVHRPDISMTNSSAEVLQLNLSSGHAGKPPQAADCPLPRGDRGARGRPDRPGDSDLPPRSGIRCEEGARPAARGRGSGTSRVGGQPGSS